MLTREGPAFPNTVHPGQASVPEPWGSIPLEPIPRRPSVKQTPFLNSEAEGSLELDSLRWHHSHSCSIAGSKQWSYYLCPSVFDVRKQTPEIGGKWCYSLLFPNCAFWKALTEWIPLPGLCGSWPWISLEENDLLSNIKDVENGVGQECLLWHSLY